MRTTKQEGRQIRILLPFQLALALIIPFVLIDALKNGYPSFLETAASNANFIRTGVAIAFVGSGLTLAIGIAMFPVLSSRSQSAAIAFLAICGVSLTVDLVHNSTVLSMLSASEHFRDAVGGDIAIYQASGAAAASLRRSAHVIQLVAIGAWIFTFYFSLFRFRLIPRPLAALGLLGILGQFVGVTVMMFLGYNPMTYLAVPLAPIHFAVAVWLIARGFPDDRTIPAEPVVWSS